MKTADFHENWQFSHMKIGSFTQAVFMKTTDFHENRQFSVKTGSFHVNTGSFHWNP